MKACFILLLTLTSNFVDALPMNKLTSDTLVILGTCTHIGQTQNIIATTYFRFEVTKVKRGSYPGDFIIIEGDVNNKGYKLFDHVKSESVNIDPEEIFPGIHTIREVLQCSAPPFIFRALSSEDEISGVTTYQYVE